jgi:hypothetical protein
MTEACTAQAAALAGAGTFPYAASFLLPDGTVWECPLKERPPAGALVESPRGRFEIDCVAQALGGVLLVPVKRHCLYPAQSIFSSA